MTYASCLRSCPLHVPSGTASPTREGPGQWELPYGPTTVAAATRSPLQRHMHDFGTTPEQLAASPSAAAPTPHANPDALYRGSR